MEESFIYVIGPINGPQKIGFAKNPTSRLKQLQTGHPMQLFLHYSDKIPANAIRKLEKLIHKQNSHQCSHGEWFNLSVNDAILECKFAVIRYMEDLTSKI